MNMFNVLKTRGCDGIGSGIYLVVAPYISSSGWAITVWAELFTVWDCLFVIGFIRYAKIIIWPEKELFLWAEQVGTIKSFDFSRVLTPFMMWRAEPVFSKPETSAIKVRYSMELELGGFITSAN